MYQTAYAVKPVLNRAKHYAGFHPSQNKEEGVGDSSDTVAKRASKGIHFFYFLDIFSVCSGSQVAVFAILTFQMQM